MNRVRTIAAEQFGVDVTRITESTSLGELGADELDLVELVMELEEEFDVTIPDEAVGGSFGPPEWQQKMNQMTMEQLAKIVEAQQPH